MHVFRVFIKDIAAFGKWVVHKIEDAPAWLTHLLVLTVKMIPAGTLARATKDAEQLLNDYVKAKGTTLAEAGLTDAEHTSLFQDVIAAVKVFDPGLKLPDVHTVAALAIGYALRGVSIIEDEINKAEAAALAPAAPTS